LRDIYRGWIVGGIAKAAEETFSEQSSEIDLCILDSTISALGDDDTLEKFFEAIPGFINSKLVEEFEREFPFSLHKKLWGALNGFQNRDLSSNSVIESVKTRRLIICMNTMNAIPGPFIDSEFLRDILEKCLGQVAPSIETACTLARWCFNSDQRIAQYARHRVTGILASVRERDDRRTALAKDHLHFPESVLQEYIAHGDSVSLAILIHVTRQAMHSDSWTPRVLPSLCRFNTHDTLPVLHHEFCALWNEIVLEARSKGAYSAPIDILRDIRHVYLALHEGTDAAPTSFSASTYNFAFILGRPRAYPLCSIASHHPESNPHDVVDAPTTVPPTRLGDSLDASPHPTSMDSLPAPGSSTALQQGEEATVVPGLPSSTDYTTPTAKGLPC